MTSRFLLVLSMLAGAVVLPGCRDSTSPRDLVPPAAPRGVYSVTGDHVVYLSWLPNTERDVAGYRVYEALCADGPDCPYEFVGATQGTRFTVKGLANGQTSYFGVTAIDRAGNESELSHEDVFDTPRPEGFGLVLADQASDPSASGYDFSAYAVRPFDDPQVDVYYVRGNGVDRMVAPFVDTDIQDAGYANSLDAVDFAPSSGWSPSGIVELIVGHCYVVWTHDDHYAKFQVARLGAAEAELDWAYQVDPGNRELKARRAPQEGARVRRMGLSAALGR